ncbi:Hypothetical predicted protein [Olea europaea subsp. europaea]|uniref:COP1-interacting protein 7 n=2 Tax=Olea europaea subsp. europaea TaxID=158383 RepID=A0A8S0UYJ2_OLEEU|nr:Hypothetical predicted protein [Olea europaea subsp. europaea]
MESKAILDYALFQLTPTRTRCDLVVFSGKKNEKLASGLVEPFISHLKYAKDQIPKGGYSMTLRPPTNAPWFTKATFQRFVRFVSTPEILESMIRVEREISQIESSIQSNEISNAHVAGHIEEGNLSTADGITKKSRDSSRLTDQDGVDGAAVEENSKFCLQRLMDTRKALLQKEQAMAYARAVVAGFEIDTIDDLISFADTFGASRLRVACIDFKELYKQKHSDNQWMDELAAVQACSIPDLSHMMTSGIMVASENNLSSGNFEGPFGSNGSLESSTSNSDGSKERKPASDQTSSTSAKVQLQVPWTEGIPSYAYNFQNPPQQYQGYPFPGMHPMLPYYPGHMVWPQNANGSPNGIVQPSNGHQNQKSSRRKEKPLDANGAETSEEDEQNESIDSYSGTDSDESKKHGKKHSSKGQLYVKKHKQKSSKTVVIRNINYITSGRHNEEEDGVSDDSSALDEASIREGVDNAIASLEKHSHLKTHKNRGHRGSHSQNGSINDAEQDFKNGIESSISDRVEINGSWDAFQNLLMRHEESTPNASQYDHIMDSLDALHFESQKIKKQPLITDDAILVTQRNGENDGRDDVEDFINGENTHPMVKRTVSEDENALYLHRSEESRPSPLRTTSDFAAESSTIRNRKAEDWFVKSFGDSEQIEFDNLGKMSHEGNFVRKESTQKTALVDDSIIIESRPAVYDQYDSSWRTDISMVEDVNIATQTENKNSNVSQEIPKQAEPDELCMVLVRESRESVAETWTPEMDCEAEISFTEADRRSSLVKENGHVEEYPLVNGKTASSKKAAGPTTKNLGRDRDVKSKVMAGSSARKPDTLSKNKMTSSASRLMGHKSKLEKEEDARKRMEELLIQRQKRIAERTAASGATPASKKTPVGSKTAPSMLEKHRSKSMVR